MTLRKFSFLHSLVVGLKASKIINLFSIIFFTIFIYSGLLKWIKIWPIDPTVLFGLLSLASAGLGGLFTRNHTTLRQNEVTLAVLFLVFSAWFLLSMLYSTSTEYVYIKARNYLLIIISFLVPYFTIRSERDVKKYLFVLSVAGLCVAFTIFYLYLLGGNDLYLTYFKLLEYGNPLSIPDYLALGGPVGATAIILLFSPNFLLKAMGLFAFTTLLLLAGRGPILSTLLVIILVTVTRFRLTRKSILMLLTVPLFVFAFSDRLLQWQGLERIVSRVEHAAGKDKSISGRFDQLVVARDLFMEYPVMGIGLGAFGVHLMGIDMRAYPHNMLVEVLVEQGLIGILLFLSFLFGFGYLYGVRFFFSSNPMYFTLASILLFEFINAMKSSSIIENRMLFALLGICVVSGKYLFNSQKLQHT